MKLIKPKEEHEKIVIKYKEEVMNCDGVICGGSNLQNLDYKEWLAQNEKLSNKETCPKNLVPANILIYVDDNETKVYGIINLRWNLNEYLLKLGGHIGYSVLPSERRKGYAKRMLCEALDIYKKRNYSKVLITCDENNIASQKTIEASGGILENIIKNQNCNTMRYWIKL